MLDMLVILGVGWATWGWMRNKDAKTRPIIRYVVGGTVLLALLLAFGILRAMSGRIARDAILQTGASSERSPNLSPIQSEDGIIDTSQATGSDLEDVLAQVADEMNATMPQRITSNVTAVSVTAQADTVIVDYKTSSSFADIDIDQFRDSEKLRLTERMCNKPAFKTMVESGAKWRAIFTDRDGRSFSVAVRSCP